MKKNNKKQEKCSACGNNQVSHIHSYISNTFTVFMEPVVLWVYENTIIRTLIEESINLFNWLARVIYIPLFSLVGLVSWNKDVTKAVSIRSRVIWNEAEKRGISMEQLMILGKPLELYMAEIHGKKIIFESIPHRNIGDKQSDLWMDDKYTLKQKLEDKGIPVPKGGSVTSYDEAKILFEKLEKPVIIKPRLGSRGRHTTTFISTEEMLKNAFRSAQKLCHYVVLEEHLVGSVYRGTAVNGKIVGILRGDPPRISGNGKDSIEMLIKAKNKTRETTVSEVAITDTLIEFLDKQGFSLETVLEQGRAIDLSEKIGISYGGNSEEIFDRTHPQIISTLERAAAVVHGEVIGFDFIIQDPTKDPSGQKWGIIECNSLPFINLHHFPLHGTPINVAGKIWDLWEK